MSRRIEVGRFPLFLQSSTIMVVTVVAPNLTLVPVSDGPPSPTDVQAAFIELSFEPPQKPAVLSPPDAVRLSTLLMDALTITNLNDVQGDLS